MDEGLYDAMGWWGISGREGREGRVGDGVVGRGEQVVRVRDVRKGVG